MCQDPLQWFISSYAFIQLWVQVNSAKFGELCLCVLCILVLWAQERKIPWTCNLFSIQWPFSSLLLFNRQCGKIHCNDSKAHMLVYILVWSVFHSVAIFYNPCFQWISYKDLISHVDMFTSPFGIFLQSGRSSLAKHGGAYFSAVCGSKQDPIAAPGPYENQEP